MEGLSHDLTKPAPQTGEEWQSPPNPLQMNTIVSERDGLYNRELEDIELQELHKGQQRWEKDGNKIKKCISKYIKCMFYGPLTGAIFLSGSIKVTDNILT